MVSRGTDNKRSVYMQMTSYTAFCNTGCTGVTATGLNVSNTTQYQGMNIIAVDPRVIPLHSIVKVSTNNNSFYAYAADTGGVIKGAIIDLLVENQQVAIKNGRQNVTVTIVRNGKG